MLNINGKNFLEMHCTRASQTFPKNFGSIIAPADCARFDFDKWRSSDFNSFAEYIKKKGAVIILGANIGSQPIWWQSPLSLDRFENTDPHIDSLETSSLLICLAHRIEEVPRDVGTCISSLSPLVTITRSKALKALSNCSPSFRPTLEYLIENKNEREIVRKLGLYKANVASQFGIAAEYLRFSNDVFDEAAPFIMKWSGTLFPGSVLAFYDGAYIDGQEPILHWKDNPKDFRFCTTCTGSPLWKADLSLNPGLTPFN